MRYGLLSLAGTEETRELMNVTLGKAKADLALIKATVLNVHTGELLEAYSVGIKGEWIASVNPAH
jgi:adenine deaminase